MGGFGYRGTIPIYIPRLGTPGVSRGVVDGLGVYHACKNGVDIFEEA